MQFEGSRMSCKTTYGKKSNTSTTSFPVQKPFTLLDCISPGEENLTPKVQNKKAISKKSNPMDNPTKKQRTQEGSKVTCSRKKSIPLSELLSNGDPIFVSHLFGSLEKPETYGLVFTIACPRHLSDEQKQLFAQWIESLGFEKVRSSYIDTFQYHDELERLTVEVARVHNINLSQSAPSALARVTATVAPNTVVAMNPTVVPQLNLIPPPVANLPDPDQTNSVDEQDPPIPRIINDRPVFFSRARSRTGSSCGLSVVTADMEHEFGYDDTDSISPAQLPSVSPFPSIANRPVSRCMDPSPSIRDLNVSCLKMRMLSLSSPRYANGTVPEGMVHFGNNNNYNNNTSDENGGEVGHLRPLPLLRSVSAPSHQELAQSGIGSKGIGSKSSELYDNMFGPRPASTATVPNYPNNVPMITFSQQAGLATPQPPVQSTTGFQPLSYHYNHNHTNNQHNGNNGKNTKRFPPRNHPMTRQKSLSFDKTIADEDEDEHEIATPRDNLPGLIEVGEEDDGDTVFRSFPHSASSMELAQQFSEATFASQSTSSKSSSSKKNCVLSDGIALSSHAISVDELEGYRTSSIAIPATPVPVPATIARTPLPAWNTHPNPAHSSSSSSSSLHRLPSANHNGSNSNSAFARKSTLSTGSNSSNDESTPNNALRNHHGKTSFIRACTEPAQTTLPFSTPSATNTNTGLFHQLYTNNNISHGTVTPGGPGISLSQNCTDSHYPPSHNGHGGCHFSTPQQLKLTCQQKREQESIWLTSTGCHSMLLMKFIIKREEKAEKYRIRRDKEQAALVSGCDAGTAAAGAEEGSHQFHPDPKTMPVIEEEQQVSMSMKQPQRSAKKRINPNQRSYSLHPPAGNDNDEKRRITFSRAQSLPNFEKLSNAVMTSADLISSPGIMGSQHKKNRIKYQEDIASPSQPKQSMQATALAPLRRQASFDSIPFDKATSASNANAIVIDLTKEDKSEALFGMIDTTNSNYNPLIPGVNHSFGENSFQLNTARWSSESGGNRVSSGSTNLEKLYYHHNSSAGSVNMSSEGSYLHAATTGFNESKHSETMLSQFITSRTKVKRSYSDASSHGSTDHCHLYSAYGDNGAMTNQSSASSQVPGFLHVHSSNNSSTMSVIDNSLNLSNGGSAGGVNNNGSGVLMAANQSEGDDESDNEEGEEDRNQQKIRNEGFRTHPFQSHLSPGSDFPFPVNNNDDEMTSRSDKFIRATSMTGPNGSQARLSRQSIGSNHAGPLQRSLILATEGFAESPIAPKHTLSKHHLAGPTSHPTNSIFGSPTPSMHTVPRTAPHSACSVGYGGLLEEEDEHEYGDGIAIAQDNSFSHQNLADEEDPQIVISSPNEHFPPAVPTRTRTMSHSYHPTIVPPNTAYSLHSHSNNTNTSMDAVEDTSDIMTLNDLGFEEDGEGGNARHGNVFDDEDDDDEVATMIDELDAGMDLEDHDEEDEDEFDNDDEENDDMIGDTLDDVHHLLPQSTHELNKPKSAKWLQSKAKMRRLSLSFQLQYQQQQQQQLHHSGLNLSHQSGINVSHNHNETSMSSCGDDRSYHHHHSMISDNSNSVLSRRRKKRSSLFTGAPPPSVAYLPAPGLTINIPIALDEDKELQELYPISSSITPTIACSSTTTTTSATTPSIAYSTRSRSNSRNQHHLPLPVGNGILTRSRALSVSSEELHGITSATGTITLVAPNSLSSLRSGRTTDDSPVGYPFSTATTPTSLQPSPHFMPHNNYNNYNNSYRCSSSVTTVTPSFHCAMPLIASCFPSASTTISSYACTTITQMKKDELLRVTRYSIPSLASSSIPMISSFDEKEKLMVIGGQFHHQYDGYCPIITCSASFQQFSVHNIQVILYTTTTIPTSSSSIGLLLALYDPITLQTTYQDLSTTWYYQPVLPVGYLVSSNNKPGRKVWYYLPKHPVDYLPTSLDMQINRIPLSLPSNLPSFGHKSSLKKLFTIPNPLLASILGYLTPHEVTNCLRLNKTCSFLIQSIRFQSAMMNMIQLTSQITDNIIEDDDNNLLLKQQMLQQIAFTTFLCQDYNTWDKYVHYIATHPYGKYLTEGACKQVYHIQSYTTNSHSALSVMNIEDLLAREMEPVMIFSELIIAWLTSYLTTTLHYGPNFVQVYELFQSSYAVPNKVWDDNLLGPVRPTNTTTHALPLAVQQLLRKKKGKQPRRKQQQKQVQCYQYMEMEYCTGGDVETYLRKLGTPPQEIVSWLFQLCYAVYIARKELDLYHGDIKLLNFFLTSPDPQICAATTTSTTVLKIGFDQSIYTLPMLSNHSTPGILKLGDFGTSRLSASQTFVCPISVHHFTTLENTPPEYFLLGNSCYPSFASDTFALGLCFLHLLTGIAPYEELLGEIHCPDYLLDQLGGYWYPSKGQNHEEEEEIHAYQVITEVIDSLIEVNEEEKDQKISDTIPGRVFYDTFYRYLVLMSDFPSFGKAGFVENPLYMHNPVYNLIQQVFQFGYTSNTTTIQPSKPLNKSNYGKNTVEIQKKRLIDCQLQWQQDKARFSIVSGTEDIMIRMRAQCVLLGQTECMMLLEGMLHWNPSSRITMYDALHANLFTTFLSNHSDGTSEDSVLEYMHYYHPTNSNIQQQGGLVLPNV